MSQETKLTTARTRLLLNCNLRCMMCFRWAKKKSKQSYLSREKISELYKDFKSLGVKKIRLTGGNLH